MKKYYPVILFFLSSVICSCSNKNESRNEIDPKDLNTEISKAAQANAEWPKEPQTIVKQLLPKEASREGNYSYEFEEHRLSENERKVIVMEEGSFEDEVSEKKTFISFELINEKWKITKMSVLLKRRA